ncbi:calcium channel flower-like [Paramacrobiotus metropolitanus]|uniref:calcium channel flower-like n=1 Tax=Paramacrobiotus metropolitanus TaxID=2943436 RepID=UPI002445C704|nr:calcium channel flower-like [Paramacrobiotus metropolitanus]
MDQGSVGAVPAAAQGPWYLTTGQRICGTVAGIAAVVFGALLIIFSVITLSVGCVIGGVLQIVFGLTMLAFEAPFLVRGLTAFGRIAAFWEHKPQWYKVILYAAMGILPLIICGFATNNILASLGIIITAVLYGMAAVGRKGSGAQMVPPGPAFQGEPYADKSGLVESQYNTGGYAAGPGGFR